MVKLLRRRTAVLTNMMGGTAMCVQSVEAWRMKSALVKAANDMVMAKSAIQMPLLEPLAGRDRGGKFIVGCAVDDMWSCAVPF
jgi:hypothetical protein